MTVKFFALWDTFNDKLISRHRTIDAVAKASNKYSRWWKKNGHGSYIPTDIRTEDGKNLSAEDDEFYRYCIERDYQLSR